MLTHRNPSHGIILDTWRSCKGRKHDGPNVFAIRLRETRWLGSCRQSQPRPAYLVNGDGIPEPTMGGSPGLGILMRPGQKTCMSSAFKPNIATLSNLPGFNPSRNSTLTPHYSSSRPNPPVERDPCIDQLALVEKRMVFRADCVEVARDDPAPASGLAQDTSQHLYLRGAPGK